MATNFALTGSATAQSEFDSPTHQIVYGNDGNYTTAWWGVGLNHWWKIDLLEEKSFSLFKLKTDGTYTVTISGSNNDIDYTNIHVDGSPTNRATLAEISGFGSVSYRYLKVVCSSGSLIPVIAEFEVWDENPTREIDATINLTSLLSFSSLMMRGFVGDIAAVIPISLSFGGTITQYNPPLLSASFPLTISFGGTLNSEIWVLSDEAWIDFPGFSVSGDGSVDFGGVAWLTLPGFSITGDGIVSALAEASIRMPVFTVDGAGLLSPVGVGVVRFPGFSVSAGNYTSETGSAEITLPGFSVSGTAIRGATGSFGVDFGGMTLDATGHLSAEGTASITLPGFRVAITMSPQSYLNMVMNLRNAAMTLYTNYNFNSLCRFNGKHFGATATGIYDLDTGTQDGSTDIEWNFRTGYLDLDQRVSKKLRQAWLSYKSSGDVILTAIMPDGTSYEYSLDGIEVDETGLRVKFGRGLKDKYISLDVKNVDGSSITLDVLRLIMDKTGKVR